LIIYLALLYYMVIKFVAVFNKSQYVTVESFKPLDLDENNLKIYEFFDSIKLDFAVYRTDVNYTLFLDCNQFLELNYFKIQTDPPLNLKLAVNETASLFSQLCYFDVIYESIPKD
jgi:hypothetical protein